MVQRNHFEGVNFMMKMIYETQQQCLDTIAIINRNMSLDGINNTFDIPHYISNPAAEFYGKWYIAYPEGDEYHHTLWMVDVCDDYTLATYDLNWILEEDM
jgi:hypothetical protein